MRNESSFAFAKEGRGEALAVPAQAPGGVSDGNTNTSCVSQKREERNLIAHNVLLIDLKKSTPSQNRQLDALISNSKE